MNDNIKTALGTYNPETNHLTVLLVSAPMGQYQSWMWDPHYRPEGHAVRVVIRLPRYIRVQFAGFGRFALVDDEGREWKVTGHGDRPRLAREDGAEVKGNIVRYVA